MTLNLLLAFVLELAMLGAWVWGGLALPLPAPGPLLAATLIPLLIIAVWGLFAAPRARFPLSAGFTALLKTLLLASGAGALVLAGQPVLAALNAALIALNLALALHWRQFDRAPHSVLRDRLGRLLGAYLRRYPGEAPVVRRFQEFLASGETLQGKSNPRRHITASTWVVNLDQSKVLLTHHAKLGIWVQPGGHTDEGEDWTEAALREAAEESGLSELALAQPGLFDLDIHVIPARGDAPEHEHYDLRFLVEADDSQPLTLSEESRALKWVPLARLQDYTSEESQFRMRRKTPR